MISPELLRRYPFFGFLNDLQLKSIAMIAEQEPVAQGTVVVREGEQATALYFLMNGGLDLFYTVSEEFKPASAKEYFIEEINPGEIFGISALIEPHVLSASARSSADSHLIRIDSEGLLALFDQDQALAYAFMRQVAKTAMERLYATRIQLAAAWA
jgi:CRP/FNR family cyclic AMP-dependent transcriptional regulator